jgi:site-specific recombinase XerD
MGSQGRQDWGDKVFDRVKAGERERVLFDRFLQSQDYRPSTVRAVCGDLRQLISWFNIANNESFTVERVTTRDIADFKMYMRNTRGLSINTCNRAVVMVRKFFAWLVAQGELPRNPAVGVKELRRVELAPKGLDRHEVRKLLREADLRQDIRSSAIFHLLLFSGCRVGDLVQLEITDLVLAERSGFATFRNGKGGKSRKVPLPLECRRAIQAWLAVRPPTPSQRVFLGCRGPLTERGVRALCDRYSTAIGIKVFPHLLRHTMAKRYLETSSNDLLGLAQILGHSNLATTQRYALKTEGQLATSAEQLGY